LNITDDTTREFLLKRHLRPSPRVLQGQALRDLATSAIDLSDGLISDLKHILKASDCGARLDLDAIPFSDAMKSLGDTEQALKWALTGGEDYELCFTVPEINRGAVDAALSHLGVDFTCIGQIAPLSEGLKLMRAGSPVQLEWQGFDHFA